jgi:hypothetical protein
MHLKNEGFYMEVSQIVQPISLMVPESFVLSMEYTHELVSQLLSTTLQKHEVSGMNFSFSILLLRQLGTVKIIL